MTRVFFQKASQGCRAVRGGIMGRVQLALKAAGWDPVELDGIYGDHLETALKDYQGKQGFQATGKITDETWSVLMKEGSPPILDRCLQLTADFEGHGFQKIAGNFDGAGATWGIIGFTLKHAEIQEILNEVLQNHPSLIDQAFGDLRDELISILKQSVSEQLAWADGISIGSSKNLIKKPWENAFNKLGMSSEVQEIQLRRVREKYWRIALQDAARFQLATEMGIALCFDIAVQNGGIDSDEQERIERWLNHNPNPPERDLRLSIADVVAENSLQKYIEDVRRRKRTIASGEGSVHDAKYATADWGIAEFPW
jgi:putative peptidoglycan binding protein/glycosyl hydrolase family 46